MDIIILYFIVLPFILFFTPIALLIYSHFFKKKQLFIPAVILALTSYIPLIFVILNAIRFQHKTENGKLLYLISENKSWKEKVAANPNIILAVNSELCAEECRRNLKKVKGRLNYVVLSDLNYRKIISPVGAGGLGIDIYSEYGSEYSINVPSDDDVKYSCKAGYLCIAGDNTSHSISEFWERITDWLFGIKRENQRWVI